MEDKDKKPNPTGEGGDGGEPKKTFDDLLKDPDYQAEFDKKVQNALAKNLEKEKAKWQKQLEDEKNEAERLAKLSDEEKHQEALDKALAETKKATAELNAYKLKEEAQKIALEKGLDVSLLNIIDFSKETAETVKTKIDEISENFNKAVEKSIKEKLKQPAPKQYASTVNDDDAKDYLDKKYKDNPYYNKG